MALAGPRRHLSRAADAPGWPRPGSGRRV